MTPKPARAQKKQERKPTVKSSRPPAPKIYFFYLSRLLKKPVRYDGDLRPFGRFQDIGALGTTSYPKAVAIQVKTRGQNFLELPWSSVKAFSEKEIVLKKKFKKSPKADFWVTRDVLDDQVVDFRGARVLRVNDVHLIYSEKELIFGHVEVGILGILRRLRFEKIVTFLFKWLFDFTIKESFVTWRHIEVLSSQKVHAVVRVSPASQRFAGIHPVELAKIMEQLGARERHHLFKSLPVKVAAETLGVVTPEFQRTMVTMEDPERIADILGEMPSKEAAGVLRDLAEPEAKTIIRKMEEEAASGVKTVLSRREQSVASVMQTECMVATLDETAAKVLRRIRKKSSELDFINPVYVLNRERLLFGVLSLRELFQAPGKAVMEEIMIPYPVTVKQETHLHTLRRIFAKYGFYSVPVVDTENHFLGDVRLNRIFKELLDH